MFASMIPMHTWDDHDNCRIQYRHDKFQEALDFKFSTLHGINMTTVVDKSTLQHQFLLSFVPTTLCSLRVYRYVVIYSQGTI